MVNNYDEMLKKQREFFATGITKTMVFRMTALRRLEKWIRAHDKEIEEALYADLSKPAFEAYATEIGVVLDELKHTRQHLERWAKPERVSGSIKIWPAYGTITPEPFGLTLIMAPWNYPFQLTVDPLIAAIAAGNCVVLKPSDYSKHTSALVRKMVASVFKPEHVTVVEGGRAENTALLDQKFDMIFFTGSPTVGKIVLAAAAPHLTPVVLELGGKSPCIVDETADVKLAAKRIVWGKFLNGGQTCVAPDYLLVHAKVKDQLIAYMKAYIRQFYGPDTTTNPDFPKVINEKHFARLSGLMENEKIICGGHTNPETNKIEPTLLDDVSWDAPVMQEEIFGPLLPIITYTDKQAIVDKITSLPKPLATYIFTKSKANEKFFHDNISFGGGCINDVVVHVSLTNLPFGGVGNSGMGAYHGKVGFDTFSHKKGVVHKSRWIDVPLRYPPYKEKWYKLMKKL